MKAYFFIFLSLIVFSCREAKTNESLYFLYYGSLKPSFRHLVLKNNPDSFVDTIMKIGLPVEYTIDPYEFNHLLHIRKSEYDFNNKKMKTGILVFYYKDEKLLDKYIFTNEDQIHFLVSTISDSISDTSLRKGITEWILGIQNLHPELKI